MTLRKILTLLVAVTLFGAVLPAAAQEGGLRYTISVTEFENQAGWSGRYSLGQAWGEVMTDILNQTGKFIVLGEADMRGAALDEQDFAASGRTAGGAKAPATGQMTPAQILVKGAITHVQHDTSGGGGGLRVGRVRVGGKKEKAEINAVIYLVDSTTGQVLASQRVTGEAGRRGGTFGYSGRGWGGDVGGFKNDNVGQAVEDAVSQGVDWIVNQLEGIPWTGEVALVRDGKIYINRGSREGVASGQTFVVGAEEVIRDPSTGEVLDRAITELATLRASDVKEKLTICDVVSGDGSRVERGMAVHLP